MRVEVFNLCIIAYLQITLFNMVLCNLYFLIILLLDYLYEKFHFSYKIWIEIIAINL